MERIKAALEKAKQQKQQTSAPAVQKTVQKTADRPVVDRESAIDLEKLNYQSTRVIELSEAHLEAHRIIAHNKNNPQTTAYDLLRTQVVQKMTDNNWKTLAITSPSPEAGKTVISINLAMAIAQQTEKTVMLVDFDLKRPKIAKYLGINPEYALNDVIESDQPLSDALVNPGIPRLIVLPTSKPVSNSSEYLSSSKAKKLISELRDRYEERIVIFDLPPLLQTDDAISMLPSVDAVMMVVANGMSKKREIEDSLRFMPDSNLLGVVLNKSTEAVQRYYY